MKDAPPVRELQELLRDIRIARPHIAARRLDRQSERLERDRIVHYAIDTNIIYFIGQPITMVVSQSKLRMDYDPEHSRNRKQIPHIGSLFRSDPMHLHAIVGAALANYIGFALTGTSPLFLPTALWREVDAMLSQFSTMDDPSVLRLADDLFDQLMDRTLKTLLRQLDCDLSDREKIISAVRAMVRHRIGRQQGLQRLWDLLQSGRIESLAARPVQLAQRRSRNLGEWQREQLQLRDDLVAAWDAALNRAGKVSGQNRLLDAEALTQVQLRNMFAEEQNSNERVIYVTADTHVLVAAEEIVVRGSKSTFADLFVRHPVAFLDDIGLGFGIAADVGRSGPTGEPASILDWMDVLLAQSTDLRNRSDLGAATEIRQGWSDLSAIQEGQLLVQFGLDEVEGRLRAELKSGDLTHAIKRLQETVVEGEADAWRRCFDVAIELALLRDPNHPRRPIRSSPPICFEAWPEAGAAIEQFKLWGSEGVPTREEYVAVRRRLEEGEDDTGYTFYLASAAFFAARGDWEPAAGLSAFSRSVASRHSSARSRGANGREANFFEAVARRHLARSVEDLVRSKELLGECRRIYEEERTAWSGPMEIVPERFDLEKLDIDQTEILFLWNDGIAMDAIEEEILSQLNGYRRLQESLASQVDKWLKSDVTQPSLGGGGHALVQCEVRTIVSALLLLGIDAVPSATFPADPISRLIERLARLREATAHLLPGQVPLALTRDGSLLAELAVTIASALLADACGRQADRTALVRGMDLVNKRLLKAPPLYPFDNKRFRTMRGILQRILRT